MNKTGMWRGAPGRSIGVLAAVIAVAALGAGPAQAHGDPADGYQGDVKEVKVDTVRTYDQAADRTTFTFTLQTKGNENVSHVLLMACPGVDIVSATGPGGPAKEGPKEDPSIEGSPHVGVKFEPGVPGTYTIVFAGNIAAAQFVVKDGTGHQHFTAGAESDLCKAVTSTPPATPEENTPPVREPQGEPQPNPQPTPSNPGAEVASTQDSQPGSPVPPAATAPPAPSASVDSTQLTAPDPALPRVDNTVSTLPRTGPVLPVLAPLGVALLTAGRLARSAGRRGQTRS